jgi:hypothetical protein
MSDAFRIQCSCGCENWVAPQQRGLFIHCAACGTRMLAVDKSAPPATSPIAQAAILANIPKRQKNRSPFEAEDVVPGDDADLPIPDRLDNLHRREIEARSAFIKSADVRDAARDEQCSQCGREIRGDWDRVQTGSVLICYVCSNQGADGLPERLRRPESELSRRPTRPRITFDQLPPTWRNPRWTRFKRVSLISVLTLLSIAVFAMTAYVSFFEFGRGDAAASSNAITARDLDGLSTIVWALAQAWLVFSEWIPIFVSLYFVRFFHGSLRGQSFLGGVTNTAASCGLYLLLQVMVAVMEITSHGGGNLLALTYFSLQLLKLWALLQIFMESFDDDYMEGVMFVAVLWTLNLFGMPYLNRLFFHSLGVI